MKKILTAAALAAVLAAGSAPTFAASSSDVAIGAIAGTLFGAAISSHSSPAPVYSQPAPVYVAPQTTTYVEPAPVYVQPAPVYVQQDPVYVAPAPVYVEGGYYRHWHRHYW